MTVEAFLSTMAALTGLLLVVASMLATELSLTVAQILQPLKSSRLVIPALLANSAGATARLRDHQGTTA